MIRLINKSGRALGLPCARYPSIILEMDEEKVITDQHFDEVKVNKTVTRWINDGFVLVQQLSDPKPDGLTVTVLKPKPETPVMAGVDDDYRPAQVKCISAGGGWWHVYVNDEKVTDKAVRKAEAEKIATEYD